jgi:phenylalanyl-tRNA synthetase alpha chain
MDKLLKNIAKIRKEFTEKIARAGDLHQLDDIYLTLFSKKHGEITNLMKELVLLPLEEKQQAGPEVNKLQDELKQAVEERKNALEWEKYQDPLIDLTYPERPLTSGMLHPTTQIIREMNSFFRYYGYSIVEGPEIETEEYNFRKLNLPEGHPATDLQDTLYVKNNILLRTHTSSIESRILSEQEPPIRTAFPGKCYRNETLNATNAAFFHQYQGVVVDKGINMQHLMATLDKFHRYLFGDDIKIRFRYKYYPEVSPGLGVDLLCLFCHGDGCNACQQRGWTEVVGSGMIHYNTLKMCGIDPEIYTGFAFGMGLDRLVMQRLAINDIRKLYGGLVYE